MPPILNSHSLVGLLIIFTVNQCAHEQSITALKQNNYNPNPAGLKGIRVSSDARHEIPEFSIVGHMLLQLLSIGQLAVEVGTTIPDILDQLSNREWSSGDWP